MFVAAVVLVSWVLGANKSWVHKVGASAGPSYVGRPTAAAWPAGGTATRADGSFLVAYEAARHAAGAMCVGSAYIEAARVDREGAVLRTYELVPPSLPARPGCVPFAPSLAVDTSVPSAPAFLLFYTCAAAAATAAPPEAAAAAAAAACPGGGARRARRGAVWAQRLSVLAGDPHGTGAEVVLRPAGAATQLQPGGAFATRGAFYAVAPVPGNVTSYGLPLAVSGNGSASSSSSSSSSGGGGGGCDSLFLLSDQAEVKPVGSEFHRSGCVSGARHGVTLGAAHVVQGYTCAEYQVPTALFENDDPENRLWLSTPSDDTQMRWNIAVPTGFPYLAGSSFGALAVPARLVAATPLMLVALTPPDGTQALVALAGRGFAALKPFTEIEGPDTADPTVGAAAFVDPALVLLPSPVSPPGTVVQVDNVRAVYTALDASGAVLGIRAAPLTPPP